MKYFLNLNDLDFLPGPIYGLLRLERDIAPHNSYAVIILEHHNTTVIRGGVMVMCPSHIILNKHIPSRSS